jgi:septal ring factor EnvC (AmiA/AmiB activator)
MKKLILFIILLLQVAVLGVAQNTASENRDELERKKKKLLEEIENAEDLLQKTRHNKNASVNEVLALKQKISSRQKLIANYNSQLNQIESSINSTQKTLRAMDIRLDSLKAEYTRLIIKSYKTNGELDKMLFIFSAKDFNDAFQRLKYLQQYSDYRQMQARLIKETKMQRIGKLKELNGQKEEKVSLLSTEQQQKRTLESEKQQKDKILISLKGQESQLMSQIKEKKKAASKLNKLIEDIIRKEIDAARKKAEPGSSKVLALTPEAKALSENFAGNQGKLPWPVERGIIASRFGKHEHEILEKVVVNNNGVDIKTQPGANVRAVFEGTVKAVLFNPAFQKAVLINHGEYFTVYSYLDEVNVKIGDKVSTKQIIGKVYTNTEEDKTEVHLEIWKNTDKLNPEFWLTGQ